MSKFDFRDFVGGPPAQVTPDPVLSDGLEDADNVPGLHAHLLAKTPGIQVLVHHLSQSIVAKSNINGICTAALFALVLEALARSAVAELPPEVGPWQRGHLLAEVRSMLERLEAGHGL